MIGVGAQGPTLPGAGAPAADVDVEDRIRRVLERREGRRPEELLDLIAEAVGSPRRFAIGAYQKPLG